MKRVTDKRFGGTAAIIAFVLLLSSSALGRNGKDFQNGCAQDEDDAQQISTVAEKLMSTIDEGLTGQDAGRFLSAFDGERMPNYSNFADQVRTFFSLHENFRVHYQIVESRISTSCKSASVSVNVELDSDDTNNQMPGVSRRGQLHLTLSPGKRGWKIVEVVPREFFR